MLLYVCPPGRPDLQCTTSHITRITCLMQYFIRGMAHPCGLAEGILADVILLIFD